MLVEALRLFNTVRYLRPIQVIGRASATLRRLKPNHQPAPTIRPISEQWGLPAWRKATMLAPNRFCFLNQDRVVTPADWNRTDWPRLWTYNLHYFDDLDAVDSQARTTWHHDLISRWIVENPAPVGPGWEPYCLSLRIVNWCRWAWSGQELPAEASQSLATQVRALADQIETHLMGNHLLANAKALVFAGLYFEGQEADQWRALGLRYLETEMAEQVLQDGGHFERSPMYHAVITADVLDLIEADRVVPGVLPRPVAQRLRNVAPAMLKWAAAMSHPDGEIAFFNDAAFGVAPSVAALRMMAEALGIIARDNRPGPVTIMSQSGYVRGETARAVLLADVGEIGADYIPGHAHADTLSFEMSLDGQRFVVNSGVSEYAGARRAYERGTAAHSTVEIDGQDSSEVWSSFRVARRARPFDVIINEGADRVMFSATHDGYRRLAGRVYHRRQWTLDEMGMVVADTLTGHPKSARAWFHLHPAIAVAMNTNSVVLSRNEAVAAWVDFEGGEAQVVETQWAAGFGLLIQAKALVVTFTSPRLISRWRWA